MEDIKVLQDAIDAMGRWNKEDLLTLTATKTAHMKRIAKSLLAQLAKALQ